MSHYSKVVNGIVTKVIVADSDFFDNFVDNTPGKWIETSYDTRCGVHVLGGTPLRKNFAGVGFSYDTTLDAFIPKKPYDSWILDEETCQWESPVAYPDDEDRYEWDEVNTEWILMS